MALQIRLETLYFITFFSLFSCYNALRQDPFSSYDKYFKEVVAGGYDPQAYPSYFSTIEDRGKFKDLITASRAEVHGLRRFSIASTSTNTVVNVDDFGATGDKIHDTEAFESAWMEACSSEGAVILEVPEEKNYLLKPITFSGPCKSNLTIQIYGTIVASDDISDYKEDSEHWLIFESVNNLLIEGGGNINGNGKIWWQNSCKTKNNHPCEYAPTALTFYNSQNLIVRNLNVQDAQQIHVCFENCNNVQASSLKVTSPENSPNTDGIHITQTQNIQITNSVIGTGDDCISIVNGSQNVQAMDITCGPGHGIRELSIGSLGSGNSEAYVSGVTVDGAKFFGTTNGVRIKTWQGGSGTAENIIFQNIDMNNVTNPIIIDQSYCDEDKPCGQQSSAVQVKNVMYKNIKGTSASEVAIKFDCSKSYPCQGIVLQNVNLQEEEYGTPEAICNNVILSEDTVFPQCP